MATPNPLPTAFGPLLRIFRLRVGLSQNQLARAAGVDPAYVNRLERAKPDSTAMPSRKVVLALWSALDGGNQDRERLLVAAGLVPEVILKAGGWDAYLTKVRGAFVDVYVQVDEALTEVKDDQD